jgi:hypothetical protein
MKHFFAFLLIIAAINMAAAHDAGWGWFLLAAVCCV